MAVLEQQLPVAGGAAAETRDSALVPLRSLPIVGAVLIGLVVSIQGNWTWALEFFHVVGGGRGPASTSSWAS